MGFKDVLQEKMGEQAMASITPSETRIGTRCANILTSTEYQLFQAVHRLVEAADAVDESFQVTQEAEERRDELLEVADAVAEQRVTNWWWEEYGGEFVDDPVSAQVYVGLSKADWLDRIQGWAEGYREKAPADHKVQEMTDAQIADWHVEKKFGVDLATFSAEVVEWTAHEHVDAIVRRNLRVCTETIHQVAGALEDQSAESDAEEERMLGAVQDAGEAASDRLEDEDDGQEDK